MHTIYSAFNPGRYPSSIEFRVEYVYNEICNSDKRQQNDSLARSKFTMMVTPTNL